MASTDVRGALVAAPLQTVSEAYRNTNYIADRVFPIIGPVAPKAKILKYLKGSWFRDEAGIRAASTRAPRGKIVTDYHDVLTKEYAFASEVTDEDRRNANVAGAPPMKPDQDAIELATDKILLKKERIIRDEIYDTTWVDGNSYGEDAQGLWAPEGSTNTFLPDIATGVKAIHAATGFKPNKLIMDLGTYLKLKECEAILNKIKYTQRGVLTADLLASMLELDAVLIGDAIRSSAKETKAGTDFTAAAIWEINAGKGMGFLFYAPPRPGLKIPSAGYQAWEAYEGNVQRRVSTWRENAEHQDVYEVAESVDITAVGTGLGYLWADTLAD